MIINIKRLTYRVKNKLKILYIIKFIYKFNKEIYFQKFNLHQHSYNLKSKRFLSKN